MSQTPSEVLAEALSNRMSSLALTHMAVARRSVDVDPSGRGISVATLSAIVNGHRDVVQPRTAGIIEQIVRWPPGSVQRILDGGDAPADDRPQDIEARVERLEVEMQTVLQLLSGVITAAGTQGDTR